MYVIEQEYLNKYASSSITGEITSNVSLRNAIRWSQPLFMRLLQLHTEAHGLERPLAKIEKANKFLGCCPYWYVQITFDGQCWRQKFGEYCRSEMMFAAFAVILEIDNKYDLISKAMLPEPARPSSLPELKSKPQCG